MKKKYFYFSFLLITIASFSQRIAENTAQTHTKLINSLLNSGFCSNITGVTITPGLQKLVIIVYLDLIKLMELETFFLKE